MTSIGLAEISLAAAVALGFRQGQFRRNARPTSLNVLLHYDDGCVARCAYCGQQAFRTTGGRERTFIRVSWPVYPVEEICDRVHANRAGMQRVCVGMVTHRRAFDDMNAGIRLFHDRAGLPISALIAPTLLRDLTRLQEVKAAGADHLGIALDAATPELFDRWRGAGVGGPHHWEHYWRAIEQGAAIFGRGNVGAHLIVGLGETEQQMIETVQRLYDLGAESHLFSFFPEAGTTMGDHVQPPVGQYRRVQLARYIINQGLGRSAGMTFDTAGQIRDFGVPVAELLRHGEAFMTSGCPGADGRVACNRPFGNERASEPFRNIPIQPEPEDVALAGYQLREYAEPA